MSDVADVILTHGRHFLVVNGMYVAMETDLVPVRDPDVLYTRWTEDALRDAARLINAAMTEPTGTARAAFLEAELARVIAERNAALVTGARLYAVVEAAVTHVTLLDERDATLDATHKAFLQVARESGHPLVASLVALRAAVDALETQP